MLKQIRPALLDADHAAFVKSGISIVAALRASTFVAPPDGLNVRGSKDR